MGFLGIRDFRISVISKSNLLIFRLCDSDFSWISQMRMRERSTAHGQTQKGCFSRDFSRISWVFKALISDF